MQDTHKFWFQIDWNDINVIENAILGRRTLKLDDLINRMKQAGLGDTEVSNNPTGLDVVPTHRVFVDAVRKMMFEDFNPPTLRPDVQKAIHDAIFHYLQWDVNVPIMAQQAAERIVKDALKNGARLQLDADGKAGSASDQ